MFYLAIHNALLLATDAEATDTQGNPLGTLLFFALIAGGGYFLFIRPQRKRMRAIEELRSSIEVGSEVRTVGGIFGTVLELDDEIVLLDTGNGGRLRIARRAVADKIGSDASEDVE